MHYRYGGGDGDDGGVVMGVMVVMRVMVGVVC